VKEAKTINSQKRAAYTGLRTDVIKLIKGRPEKVLDVGCSNGELIKFFKREWGTRFAVGIEIDKELAREARSWADKIIVSDLDKIDHNAIDKTSFDLIVFADILEHTKNPDIVLKEILKLASQNTQIIISLPNIQHWTAIKNLLIGKFPQRERGLFDKTHLRFFTFDSIKKLAFSANLKIEVVARNYRITDGPGKLSFINRFSKFIAFWPFKPFLTYQYVLSLTLIKS